MKTGPENLQTKKAIQMLEKSKSKAWARVAELLGKPKRGQAEVSLDRISKYVQEGELVAVPGRVLDGVLEKKVVIACLKASANALKSASKAGAKIISFQEAVKQNPSGKKVRIMA